MFSHASYVHITDFDGPLIHWEYARNGVEQGRFTGAITTDNGTEVPFFQFEVNTSKGCFFIDCAFKEGLYQVIYF